MNRDRERQRQTEDSFHRSSILFAQNTYIASSICHGDEKKNEKLKAMMEKTELSRKEITLQEYPNKPDRAKMRPDCVSACIDFGARHARYMEGQMDGRTD